MTLNTHETKTKAITKVSVTKQEALDFHKFPTPGKVSITPSKPMMTVKDLSLAYSPGVAYPCLEIQQNPLTAYDYTSKGNMVAVISNGTAVLGLGNLGSLASKPVMEGKSVLFKRFAHIDSVDIEVDSYTIEDFCNVVAKIGETWGGINLEDIKSPECFEIETILKEKLSIPVFHDDQHGTAIITVAGLINACDITGRKIEDIKIVMNGAGAAGIACLNLIKKIGVKAENILLCDRTGVIYKGRNDIANDEIKQRYAIDTKARTVTEALDGADVFIGLSAKDAITKETIMKMAKNPIIFAMANPDPEIKPEDALEARPDAIVATGRSDYPNQVNNVMGFPYIFRGALDVRATEINDEMKMAAALAIAKLARLPVPSEVIKAYPDASLEYGPQYIIPTPFDPRLIVDVSTAVAKAAMDTGVARMPITDWEAYKTKLRSYVNPTVNAMGVIMKQLQKSKKRIVFAEGEELEIIKAAIFMQTSGLADVTLVGKQEKIEEVMQIAALKTLEGVKIANASINKNNDVYIKNLHLKLGRKGFLLRDCERMVKTDRNIFSSCMVENGDADCLVTGYTRGYAATLEDITKVISKKDNEILFGLSVLISESKTIFISDTAINEFPKSEELVKIAKETANKVRTFGIEPRVAFISHSNFGAKKGAGTDRVREAIAMLDKENVDFEYDGEMTITTALSGNPKKHYSFNRLSGSANVLIMPGLHSAHISTSLVTEFTGGVVVGSVLTGLSKSVQIISNDSDLNDIINMASLACVYC
jgi:malate dehydrogenase (oxaloacetate-decarboxylating)(NADP+)